MSKVPVQNAWVGLATLAPPAAISPAAISPAAVPAADPAELLVPPPAEETIRPALKRAPSPVERRGTKDERRDRPSGKEAVEPGKHRFSVYLDDEAAELVEDEKRRRRREGRRLRGNADYNAIFRDAVRAYLRRR